MCSGVGQSLGSHTSVTCTHPGKGQGQAGRMAPRRVSRAKLLQAHARWRCLRSEAACGPEMRHCRQGCPLLAGCSSRPSWAPHLEHEVVHVVLGPDGHAHVLPVTEMRDTGQGSKGAYPCQLAGNTAASHLAAPAVEAKLLEPVGMQRQVGGPGVTRTWHTSGDGCS